MKLTCRYCGFTVDYKNGRGWFPGYAQEVINHIMAEHVKIDQAITSDGIAYSARIDPGYSENVPWPLGSVSNFRAGLTVTQEDRLSPPPYVEPTEPTVKSDG